MRQAYFWMFYFIALTIVNCYWILVNPLTIWTGLQACVAIWCAWYAEKSRREIVYLRMVDRKLKELSAAIAAMVKEMQDEHKRND